MFHPVFLFLNIGTPELILILFVALLLFGGEKLPSMARTIGKGIRDFKDASEGVKREIQNQIENFDEKKETPAPAVAETKTPELPHSTPLAGASYIGVTEQPVEHTASYADVSHLIADHTEGTAPEVHADASHLIPEHTTPDAQPVEHHVVAEPNHETGKPEQEVKK